MGGLTPIDQAIATYTHLSGSPERPTLSHLLIVKAPNDLSAAGIAAPQNMVGHSEYLAQKSLIPVSSASLSISRSWKSMSVTSLAGLRCSR
jgi:hypothetical protein